MPSPHDQQALHDALQSAYAWLDTVTDTARALFEALTDLGVAIHEEDAARDAVEKAEATMHRQQRESQAKQALRTADLVLDRYADVGGEDV